MKAPTVAAARSPVAASMTLRRTAVPTMTPSAASDGFATWFGEMPTPNANGTSTNQGALT